MVDAHVFILAREKTFAKSTVVQMLGRGCRSFGVPEGTYYTCLMHESANVWRQLEAQETEFKEGARHLGQFFKHYDKMTLDGKKVCYTFFLEGYWMSTKTYVREQCTAVYKQLYPNETTNEVKIDKQTIEQQLAAADGPNDFVL